MTRFGVVGFGNPIRSDDGVGWRVAERLGAEWGDHISVICGQQPLPEWAELLSACDLVFVVDATLKAETHVRLRPLEPTMDAPGVGAHALDVEQLLQLCQRVYGRAPRTYLVSIPAENMDFGQQLSARTERAAAVAARLISAQIRRR